MTRYPATSQYLRHCAQVLEKLGCKVKYKRNGGAVIDPPDFKPRKTKEVAHV